MAELKNRDLLIEKLRHQIAGQNSHRFGSKAEGIDQLQLRREDEEVEEAASAPPEHPKTQVTTQRLSPSVNRCQTTCRA